MPPTQNDLEVPENYTYRWSPDTSFSISEFLSKFKPSLITDDGTKPWIWVQGPAFESGLSSGSKMERAVGVAAQKLEEATDAIEAVQNDDNIPVRTNKKTGAKSKKEVREGIQRETVKSFREIAVKYGFTYGKWLCYAKNDTVDSLWNKISTSIVDGPLAVTTAQLAKVSTTKASDVQSQHVICLYLPNIFDKDEAKEVLQILIKEHGITPTGAKPDLYTHINLDSKHKSGIRSTVWQPRELLSDAEIKALRDAYHAQPKNPKVAAAQPKPEATSEVKPGAHPKIPWARSMTKSTAYDSDENKNPFSDDEVDTGAAHAEAERRAALAKKLASSPSKRQLFAPAPRKRKANLQDDHVAGRPKKARASSEDATESEEEVVVRGR